MTSLRDQNPEHLESRGHTHSCGPKHVAQGSGLCRRSPNAISEFLQIGFNGFPTHHGKNDDPRQIQRSNNFQCHGGFARARASSNANDACISPGRGIMSPLHTAKTAKRWRTRKYRRICANQASGIRHSTPQFYALVTAIHVERHPHHFSGFGMFCN